MNVLNKLKFILHPSYPDQQVQAQTIRDMDNYNKFILNLNLAKNNL